MEGCRVSDALALFLEDLRLSGRISTATTYRSLLRFDGEELTPQAFRAVMRLYEAKKATPATLSTVRGALSSFGRYCAEQGWVFENPAKNLPRVKVPEPEGRYLTADQVRHVWKVAGQRGPGLRPDDLRLIILLLMEGLRAGELLGLRWSDLDGDRIRILGKGKKRRVVPLSDTAKGYLEARQRKGPRIFTGSRSTLYWRIRKLGDRAGISGLHPHIFRHTFASLSLLEGADNEHIRVLGGWAKNSQAMEGYIRRVRQDAAVQDAHRRQLTKHLLE